MCRRFVLLFLLMAVLGGSAQAQYIASIDRTATDGDAAETPEIAVPLEDGAEIFMDRTHAYTEVPAELVGAEYVKTCNDNKDFGGYEIIVTMAKNATLYLIIDNRVGDTGGGQDVDPALTPGMSWVTDLGFTDTGLDIAIDEDNDGSINQYSSLFSREVSAGEVLTLGAQSDGGSRNMYGIAASAPDTLKAHNPQPKDKATGVDVPSVTLSWKTGVDPNDANVPNPNIVEHYLWVTVPFDAANPVIPANPWEAAGTQQFTIAADTNPADGNVDATASQVLNGLPKDKLYLWVVDEGLTGSSGPLEADPDKIIWGNVWRFETISSGPVIDANSIVTWLKDGTTVVDLGATVTDSSGDLSVIQWSVLTTPLGAAVDIADPAVAGTTATLTETGTYVLKLYARDAAMHEDEAIIEINVYNDSCEAAKNKPGGYIAPEFDFNDDCKEDFIDFAILADKWLENERLPGDFVYDAGNITVPFVQFTNPLNGATVSGEIVINAIAYDPRVGTNDGDGMEGDGGVDFEIRDAASGTLLDSHSEGSAAWNWTVDSTLVPNGVYKVRVIATSDAGYVKIEEISVTVSN